MTKPLNLGMIGYGFMGRAHSNAYRKVNNFFDLAYRPVLKAACARDKDNVKKFADKWGYESIETDWRKLLDRKDIDAVDVCVPNNLHCEIALALVQQRTGLSTAAAALTESGAPTAEECRRLFQYAPFSCAASCVPRRQTSCRNICILPCRLLSFSC